MLMRALIAAFLGYFLLDATFARGVLYRQEAFMVIWGLVALMLLFNLRRLLVTWGSLLYALGLLVALAMVSFQSPVYLNYVLGDIATTSLPLMLFLLIRAGHLRITARSLFFLYAGGVVIYSLSPLLSEPGLGRNFAPPNSALLFLAVYFLFKPTPVGNGTHLGRVLYGTVLLLSLFCGQRSAFFSLLILTAFAFIWENRLSNPGVLGPLMAAIFTISFVAVVFEKPIEDGIDSLLSHQSLARFRSMDAPGSGLDTSVSNRFLEVSDALKYNNATFLQTVLGKGHGATYEIYESYPARNIVDGLFVHNIHFGPAMVLYRYGLIGVIAGAVFYLNVFSAFRLGPATSYELCLFLAILCYSINFLFRNVVTDPVFSLFIASYCANRSLQWQPHRALA